MVPQMAKDPAGWISFQPKEMVDRTKGNQMRMPALVSHPGVISPPIMAAEGKKCLLMSPAACMSFHPFADILWSWEVGVQVNIVEVAGPKSNWKWQYYKDPTSQEPTQQSQQL
jgi:ferredoxin-like protein FixX